MKSRKFIFKWLLFTFTVCCCSMFVKLSLNEPTPSLSRENVEALADWEDDYQEIIKHCNAGNGWCLYNGNEFLGLVYVEK